MAYRLTWSPVAQLDLRKLATYIAEQNPTEARKFVRSVFQVVQRLRDFPESGRMVPEFNDPRIREIIRRPCRVVYRTNHEEQLIEIVRIWHATRGIPKL